MLRRLRFLLTRRQFDSDLEEEMRLHQELRAQKSGDSEVAQRRFGNNTRLKEESREAYGWTWLESVVQDLRYAVRVLRRSPVFTTSAVVTLALGIGANAALFTLVNALLLKPLPIPNPNRLVELSSDRAEASTAFCYRALEFIAQRTKTVAGLFTWYGTNRTVGQNIDAQTISGAVASGNAFQTLGIKPQIGRFFTPEDDKPSAPLVVILSDHFWRSRFNGNPHILGRTILLDRHRFVILGVAPKSFYGMSIGENPKFIIPIHAAALLDPQHDVLHETNNWWLPIFGRLQSGVSMQQANTELRVLSRPVFQSIAPAALSPTDLRDYYAQKLLAVPGAMGAQFVADQYRQPLLILLAISGLVLLVACVNIANLLLARAAARSREISVRLAVGAPRWRVIRQLLTESVLLALLGTVFGTLLAWSSLGLAVKILPFTLDLAPDWRIAAFLAALAVATALVFGAAPAIAGTDLPASEVLKQGRAGSSRSNRINSFLICGQIALSLVLLMGAFLFIRTFENLRWQNLGFDSRNLVFVGLDSGRSGLKGPALAHFYRELLTSVGRLSSVRSIGLTSLTPMTGSFSWDDLSPDLWPSLSRAERTLYTQQVSPDYFQTMRITVLQGRAFTPGDAAPSEPQPAIITTSAARTYFPKGPAVGQLLRVDTNKENRYRIVGVVRDSKIGTLRDRQIRALYTDAEHAIGTEHNAFAHRSNWTLAIRVQENPSRVLAAIRAFVKRSGKDITVSDDLPVNSLIDQGLRTERTMAILASFFAAVTAILVALGLYGLLAYTVTRRTTEIGVRLALGATQKSVLWLILKDALFLTIVGICVGIPAVLLSGKLISSMLYGTSASDPVTLSITALLMLLIAALAGFLPAWRAAKVDPTIALRWE